MIWLHCPFIFYFAEHGDFVFKNCVHGVFLLGFIRLFIFQWTQPKGVKLEAKV